MSTKFPPAAVGPFFNVTQEANGVDADEQIYSIYKCEIRQIYVRDWWIQKYFFITILPSQGTTNGDCASSACLLGICSDVSWYQQLFSRFERIYGSNVNVSMWIRCVPRTVRRHRLTRGFLVDIWLTNLTNLSRYKTLSPVLAPNFLLISVFL